MLGVLIARAAGQPLEAFFRQRIFEPLGMQDTAFSVPADKLDRLPPCYAANPDTGTLELFDDARGGLYSRPPGFPSGAGGLVSTVHDYLAFGQMMLNTGVLGRKRILAEASVELMTTDHLTAEQRAKADVFLEGHGWGFGMSVLPRRGGAKRVPAGYGWDGGYGTSWRSDPEHDLVAILMTQRLISVEPWRIHQDFWSAVYQAIAD